MTFYYARIQQKIPGGGGGGGFQRLTVQGGPMPIVGNSNIGIK